VGYRAATLRYPAQGVAVMVLCNYARTNPSAMAEEVGAIWLEDVMTPPEPQEAEARSPRPAEGEEEDAPSLQVRRALSGDFYSPELDAIYRIFEGRGRLLLDVNGAMVLPLQARGRGTLVADDWLTLTFQVGEGRVGRFEVSSGRVEGVAFDRR